MSIDEGEAQSFGSGGPGSDGDWHEEGSDIMRRDVSSDGHTDDRRGRMFLDMSDAVDVVDDNVFEELCLSPDGAREVKDMWAAFLRCMESPEAAAEAIMAAVLEAFASLQNLFRTPAAIISLRILQGLSTIVGSLHDARGLKAVTESLGFKHLDYDITPLRVELFRDAIVDVITTELGSTFTPTARNGLKAALNYVGGALMYVRRTYADRLKVLANSWAVANRRTDCKKADRTKDGTDESVPSGSDLKGRSRRDVTKGTSHAQDRNIAVPTSFPEMFKFNATVMGFGNDFWMDEVLLAMDALVRNVANANRLREECDVLSLRLSKYRGPFDLSDFKAVMLASLRSLVPKGWSSDHEVAWTWLWQNVAGLLDGQTGKPARQEQALSRMLTAMQAEDRSPLFLDVYRRFFEAAPAGMNFFKQSTTRLLFVADKVFDLTLEMYRDPEGLVNKLSALGLRHVGYGIPEELSGPFVSSYVAALRQARSEKDGLEAFEWSLMLISRILARVINEGSTLVMRAINANSAKQLTKAVALAPRSDRAEWVLNITVGLQSISPLLWAVETGSFDAAGAIIKDLLTIRADRDRYYFGVDPLFQRHPDIIKRLCMQAPALLPTLLDGLIWRSRLTENSRRRVVYFLRHLVVGEDGEFSQAVEWITANHDPRIVCHPVVACTIDLVWNGIMAETFLFRKTWLLLAAIVFMGSQCILNAGVHDELTPVFIVRLLIVACRCFIFLVSWPSMAMVHIRRGRADYRNNNFMRIFCFRLPGHLVEVNSLVSLCLCFILFVMLFMCPILNCLGKPSIDGSMQLFTERCEDGDRVLKIYNFLSMCGMLCYWALLADLSVFSHQVCAFTLIFGHVLSEVVLFLMTMFFILIMFATAVTALKEQEEHFHSIPLSARSFLMMFLGMVAAEQNDQLLEFPLLFCSVILFAFITGVYMVSLFVAQLSCSYSAVYGEMLGRVRLKRGEICVASIPNMRADGWNRFLHSCRFDEPCEFGEGDLGMPGAIQMTEPAGANITTVDLIRRFGGSTSPSALWPEDDAEKGDAVEDNMEKMNRMLKKIMHKLDIGRRKKRGGSSVKSADGGTELGSDHDS